ncbi:hypothetical protein COOONC_04111 [Cooperia oncophora]
MNSDCRFIIQVWGYDEKQPQLVEHIIKRMIGFKPDPLRFDALFDEVKRWLKNSALADPISLSDYYIPAATKRSVLDQQAAARRMRRKVYFSGIPEVVALSPMIRLN